LVTACSAIVRNIGVMRQVTLARGRLAEHPVWSRALARADLAGRVVLPVIVGSAVEDREKIEGAPWLERLSLTEVVREARAAASAGLAGLLLFGISDRKDEHAMLASEPDHVVARAIRAVKEAVPELGVATDVCVCAYTAHGQCVLFGADGADAPATLERLGAIARVHAEAGADLLIPSGMLEGSVRAVRAAVSDDGHADVPVAAMAKLESHLYALHRHAVSAIPITERAVPLLPTDDAEATRARAVRDVASGADAIIVKPGAPTLDIVALLASSADRPLISYFTSDEHAFLVAGSEGVTDPTVAERELVAAARRAGAALVITYGAFALASS